MMHILWHTSGVQTSAKKFQIWFSLSRYGQTSAKTYLNHYKMLYLGWFIHDIEYEVSTPEVYQHLQNANSEIKILFLVHLFRGVRKTEYSLCNWYTYFSKFDFLLLPQQTIHAPFAANKKPQGTSLPSSLRDGVWLKLLVYWLGNVVQNLESSFLYIGLTLVHLRCTKVNPI